MVTPAARRTAVAHLTETYEMSERRACTQPSGACGSSSHPPWAATGTMRLAPLAQASRHEELRRDGMGAATR